MTRFVLVLNAGSSSLKYQVVDPATGTSAVRGHIERIEVDAFPAELVRVAEQVAEAGVGETDLLAVAHRVVHGGHHHTRPTLLDEDVVADIEDLARLAPLHNPPAVLGIRAARRAWPDAPQAAVFDTAFFAVLPDAASTYALDANLARRLEIRRYGMHGTSHEYVAGVAAAHLGRDLADLDQVTLHLGNGASVAAIRGGRPVETSMGMTPLEGLVMGSRAGDLDPGVVLHLLRHGGLDLDGVEQLLHHRSGLQGLAGHHDFRDLRAALERGDEAARLALDVYCHRVRKYIGAYLAVLDGADTVVFTAGVGENDAMVRAACLSGLDRLGIEIDPELNTAAAEGPRVISTQASRITVLVVPTNEELAIARKVAALVA